MEILLAAHRLVGSPRKPAGQAGQREEDLLQAVANHHRGLSGQPKLGQNFGKKAGLGLAKWKSLVVGNQANAVFSGSSPAQRSRWRIALRGKDGLVATTSVCPCACAHSPAQGFWSLSGERLQRRENLVVKLLQNGRSSSFVFPIAG
jgi:hypothetical protein